MIWDLEDLGFSGLPFVLDPHARGACLASPDRVHEAVWTADDFPNYRLAWLVSMTGCDPSGRRSSSVAERIQSERTYHERHYREQHIPLAVSFDLARSKTRRPQNLTWAYYDTICQRLGSRLSGARILVAGCGTGLVALNLASSGAIVEGFDLSDEAISICRRRAAFNSITGASFFVSAFEELNMAAARYDAIVGEMILHHVDIPLAVEKIEQLLKPCGVGVFMEWKKYALIDSIRSWAPLKRLFPPGGFSGYATDFERKLNRDDFATLRKHFPDLQLDHRYCLRGKLDYVLPPDGRFEKLDLFILRMFPFLKPFTDGVIISFVRR